MTQLPQLKKGLEYKRPEKANYFNGKKCVLSDIQSKISNENVKSPVSSSTFFKMDMTCVIRFTERYFTEIYKKLEVGKNKCDADKHAFIRQVLIC